MMKFLLSGWGKTIGVGIILSIAFTFGYKVASNKHKADTLDKLEALRAEAQARYDKDLKIMMASEKVIVKTKEVIKYVEREIPSVETPECTRLGDDWLRLYNNAVKAGNLQRPSELSD
jgi:hypothetical protein